MSDTIITVQDYPYQVNVTDTPITISVAEVGIQGPPGTPGTGGSSVSTGVSGALQTQITDSGAYLLSQIQVSNAGVNSLNKLSGVLSLTGLGSNIITINGQIIQISGSTTSNQNVTDVVYTSGRQIISGLKTFTTGIVVPYVSGSSNYIGGLIDNNGVVSNDCVFRNLNDGGGVQALSYGIRVLRDGIQNYSVEWGNRFLRDASQNYVLDWNNNILSGNWTKNGNYILTVIDSGNLQSEINSIQNQPVVTGISINGSTQHLTGYVIFSAGNSDILLGQSTNGIIISVPGLQQTGSNLQNKINNLYSKDNTSGFLNFSVTGLSINGNPSITGLVNFTGIGGLNIIQSNNIISFSGGAGGGITNNSFYINSGSGLFLFQTVLTSGIDKQFINFPTILDNNPTIVNSITNSISNNIIYSQISGVSTSGYWIILSDVTNNTGYILNSYAANSTGTGLSTTIIINNISGSSIIPSGLTLTPVLNSGNSFNLTSASFYIHTGYSVDTWILPSASNSPGKFYFIKNKGNNIMLTGNSSTERLFTTSEVLNFPINSGEAYIIASDSNQWCVM